jgi:glutathione S-transferase
MNQIRRFKYEDGQRPLARTRRSLPPELTYAVDLERLRWALKIKRRPVDTLDILARPRRLGVRIRAIPKNGRGDETADGDSPVLGVGAALLELDRRWPDPPLTAGPPALRARSQAMERWLLDEVGRAVTASLVETISLAPRPHAEAPDRIILAAAIADPIRRALDLVSGLTARHGYLLGEALTLVDLTAAAVLAPIARKDGWVWAGRTWTPLGAVAGRTDLARHRGAAWVRDIYDRHAEIAAPPAEPARAWVP